MEDCKRHQNKFLLRKNIIFLKDGTMKLIERWKKTVKKIILFNKVDVKEIKSPLFLCQQNELFDQPNIIDVLYIIM